MHRCTLGGGGGRGLQKAMFCTLASSSTISYRSSFDVGFVACASCDFKVKKNMDQMAPCVYTPCNAHGMFNVNACEGQDSHRFCLAKFQNFSKTHSKTHPNPGLTSPSKTIPPNSYGQPTRSYVYCTVHAVLTVDSKKSKTFPNPNYKFHTFSGHGIKFSKFQNVSKISKTCANPGKGGGVVHAQNLCMKHAPSTPSAIYQATHHY